jgi:2-amino-4-hydroxy-6-hydroxymethyldihydropteridine diphosphokinase
MMRGFLSLGSNLGDREALLRQAMKRLAMHGVTIIEASHIYETIPIEVGNEQNNYLNMVIRISFAGEPFDLLAVCRNVEEALGRRRPYVHSPRTVDIDILLLDGVVIHDERLVLPHPGMESRAFVLFPLEELSPGMVLPSGSAIADVKEALGNDEIVKIWNG